MEVPGASSRRYVIGFWIAATAIGLTVRVLLVPLGPKYGYDADHDDFVRWGIQATDEGLTTLYDHPPARRDMRSWINGQWRTRQRDYDRLCNYPPLSTYLLYLSGGVFKSVSEDRLINTTTARFIFEIWGLMADFLLAWGCASLVAKFRSNQAARWTYLVVLLAPPFWWDSSIWGQMDSVVLAPAVWMVRFISDRRWVLAGIFYGLTASIKPQAVLFLPLWALVLVRTRPIYKPMISLAIAGTVLFVIALPFTFASGLTWWRASYVANLFEAYSGQTTLMAMNIWYVDLLLTDSATSRALWCGTPKDTWGNLFLLVGLGVPFVWMAWRWRRDSRAYVLYAGLSLLAFVMLPTRVHDRYLILPLPFLIVAAMIWVRFWPGVVLLIVVALFQITWPVWRQVQPGTWPYIKRNTIHRYEYLVDQLPPEKRSTVLSETEFVNKRRERYLALRHKTIAYEWLFTCLALAGALGAAVAFCKTTPEITWHEPVEHANQSRQARRTRQKQEKKKNKKR